MSPAITRRGFVQGAAAGTAGLLLSSSPTLAQSAAAASATGDPIVINGWQPERSNWPASTSGPRNNAALPGGKYYRGNAEPDAPDSGYLLSYSFQAPAAGAYALSWISTPPQTSWTSPFGLRVNDGPWETTGSAVQDHEITDVFRAYRFGTVRLESGSNTLSFRVDERRNGPDDHYLFYLNTVTLTRLPQGIDRITPGAALGIFTGRDAVTLSVVLTQPVSSATRIAAQARAYSGQVVRSRHTTISAGHDKAPFDFGTLPHGSYRIEVQLGNTPVATAYTAVVPRRRTTVGDTPFATDVAAASLVPAAQVDDLARAITLTGVSWTRGRYHWDLVEPKQGHFTYGALDKVVNAISGTGVSILEAYNRAPGWMREDGDRLPSDLQTVYDVSKSTAAHNGSRVDAWEVWNEANGAGTSTHETVDQYAAFLKAAAIGYADSGAQAKVCITGLGHFPRYYADAAFRNDVDAYLDAYSFHGYTVNYSENGPAEYPFPIDSAHEQRAFVDTQPGDLDLWMSESGIPIPATSDGKGLTTDQQRAQARYLVESAVQAVAAGVRRTFWFVLPYYDEGGVLYGVFAPQNSGPYPGYSAMAVMTWVLGRGDYLGSQAGLPPGVTGHRFDAGHAKVVVLWASQATTVELPASSQLNFTVSLMGECAKVARAGNGNPRVIVGPDPLYLCERRPGAAAAATAPTASQPIRASSLSDARRVVVQPRFPEAVEHNAKIFHGYQLDPDGVNSLQCRVYNFNDHAVSGTFTAEAPGWTVSPATQDVSLGTRAVKTLSFQVTRDDAPMKRVPLTMTAEFPAGSSLAVADVMPVLADVTTTPLPGSGDPASWDFSRKDALSAGATGSATVGDGVGTVRFTYHFPDDGKTGYGSPFLDIADASGLASIDGFALDLFADADMPHVAFKLIANQANGSRYWTAQAYPIDAGWHQIIAPVGHFSFAAFGGPDPNHDFRPETLTSIQVWIATSVANPAPITIKNFGWYTL